MGENLKTNVFNNTFQWKFVALQIVLTTFYRIVEMTAEVIGVPYEFKKCDLMAGENMKVKKNNQKICLVFITINNSSLLAGENMKVKKSISPNCLIFITINNSKSRSLSTWPSTRSTTSPRSRTAISASTSQGWADQIKSKERKIKKHSRAFGWLDREGNLHCTCGTN